MVNRTFYPNTVLSVVIYSTGSSTKSFSLTSISPCIILNPQYPAGLN